MNHQYFVLAAFGVTLFGVSWLILSSYIAMRRLEALAGNLRGDG